MTASSVPGRPARSGLVTFGGVMLLIAAAFNLLDGIVALVNDDYYFVVGERCGICHRDAGTIQYAAGAAADESRAA